ncbi:hypothetical protein F8M41_017495 [Gigaspora margarita]|uniref:Uncharacterized protein n=1 Tax=Gigaspora margarita TaxID=4874 RepID=A0A8H4AN70_GIGMA|nr:hypothetical protein F8M41_017495 [Gigaspora margarita]
MLASALKTIFLDTDKNLISNYEKQLCDMDELDPVLIITPNRLWIIQYSWDAYYAVMDLFATHNLTQNRRRDKDSRCIFHFRKIDDLFQVRRGIKNNNLAPNAFCISPGLHADYQNNLNVQLVPVGMAWILMKVGSLSSDFGSMRTFFTSKVR